jgi:hypothetical protein
MRRQPLESVEGRRHVVEEEEGWRAFPHAGLLSVQTIG